MEPPTVREPVSFDGPLAGRAVEVAPRIWWVGRVIDDDPFQSHPYLVEAGDRSVLVDPGSELTIDVTLEKVREVVDLGDIATILLHHSDPDCADAVHRLGRVLGDHVRIVTEWRSAMLLRHLAPRFEMTTIEDLDWHLELEPGRRLEFLLTPYLHFPGAFVTHDTSTGSVLTADLFGGFNHARRLWATSAADFEDLRRFHEHYMPSREILMSGLASIRSRFGLPDRLLPQHGYLVPRELVEEMFDALFGLDCGVMLLSRSDVHLAKLVDAAAAVRRVQDVLRSDIDLVGLLETTRDIVGSVFAIASLAIERREADGTFRRYDASDPDGTVVDGPSPAEPHRWVIALTDDDQGPQLVVELGDAPVEVSAEILQMFAMLLPTARPAVERMLDLHVAQRERELWRQSASLDPLTGLENRQVLDTRSNLDHAATVLMVDLDDFKHINDRWGHPVGDEVLRRTAAAIRSVLRADDRAFRYGGEEFVVVASLADPAGPGTPALAERIRHAVAEVDASDVMPGQPVSASVGGATGLPGQSLAGVIERADLALYRAKRLGKNRSEVAAD